MQENCSKRRKSSLAKPKLHQISKNIIGKEIPSNCITTEAEGNIPIIKSTDMKHATEISKDLITQYISPDDVMEQSIFVAKEGDTLVVYKGPNRGTICYVGHDFTLVAFDQDAVCIRPKEKFDSKYIFFFILYAAGSSYQQFKREIRPNVSLTLTDLLVKDIVIVLPEYQSKIRRILEGIDKKIRTDREQYQNIIQEVSYMYESYFNADSDDEHPNLLIGEVLKRYIGFAIGTRKKGNIKVSNLKWIDSRTFEKVPNVIRYHHNNPKGLEKYYEVKVPFISAFISIFGDKVTNLCTHMDETFYSNTYYAIVPTNEFPLSYLFFLINKCTPILQKLAENNDNFLNPSFVDDIELCGDLELVRKFDEEITEPFHDMRDILDEISSLHYFRCNLYRMINSGTIVYNNLDKYLKKVTPAE